MYVSLLHYQCGSTKFCSQKTGGGRFVLGEAFSTPSADGHFPCSSRRAQSPIPDPVSIVSIVNPAHRAFQQHITIASRVYCVKLRISSWPMAC
jgi:hypothetical protein